MDGDLDEVRTELAAIADELIGLPAEAFARRADLHDRQHELRAEAARLGAHDPTWLRAREAVLLRRIAELDERRLRVSSVGGGAGGAGGAAIDPYEFIMLNQAITEGLGIPELQAELARVRARLAASG